MFKYRGVHRMKNFGCEIAESLKCFEIIHFKLKFAIISSHNLRNHTIKTLNGVRLELGDLLPKWTVMDENKQPFEHNWTNESRKL